MPTIERSLSDWPRLDVCRMLTWSDEGGYTDPEWQLEVEWWRVGPQLELHVVRGETELDDVFRVKRRGTKWSVTCPQCRAYRRVLYLDDDLDIQCAHCLALPGVPSQLRMTATERRLVEHIERGYLRPVLECLLAGKSRALVAMRAMEHAGLSPRRMTVASETWRRQRVRRAELERRKWEVREAEWEDI